MTLLVVPGPEVQVPAHFAAVPVSAPVATSVAAEAVRADESGEPLVPLPEVLATRILYDDLELPPRGQPLLRAGVVARLVAAQEALPEPFGLVVLDGWRSARFQRDLLAYYRSSAPDLEDGWVSDPDSGPTPPHTTGGAVDLTLSWRGTALALGTDYDAFEADAHPAALEQDAPDGDDRTRLLARDLRRMLAQVLRAQDLVVYPIEWWHWSYGDQWWAAELGLPTCPYGAVADV